MINYYENLTEKMENLDQKHSFNLFGMNGLTEDQEYALAHDPVLKTFNSGSEKMIEDDDEIASLLNASSHNDESSTHSQGFNNNAMTQGANIKASVSGKSSKSSNSSQEKSHWIEYMKNQLKKKDQELKVLRQL